MQAASVDRSCIIMILHSVHCNHLFSISEIAAITCSSKHVHRQKQSHQLSVAVCCQQSGTGHKAKNICMLRNGNTRTLSTSGNDNCNCDAYRASQAAWTDKAQHSWQHLQFLNPWPLLPAQGEVLSSSLQQTHTKYHRNCLQNPCRQHRDAALRTQSI